MLRILLPLLVILGLIYLSIWLRKTSTIQRGKTLKLLLLYGAALILFLLVITGRVHWLFALPGVALPWVQRAILARQAWRLFKSRRPPTSGNRSKVETHYFIMSLDHDSGDLTGEIIRGKYSGRQVSDLLFNELLELMDECRSADPQSAALLEAFLDRNYDSDWRSRDPSDSVGSPPGTQPMDRREAAEILGIEEDSSKDVIRQAHRKLIQRLHSDRGGTDYLASLVNQARDVLLED